MKLTTNGITYDVERFDGEGVVPRKMDKAYVDEVLRKLRRGDSRISIYDKVMDDIRRAI